MSELKRITLEYSAHEDRMRLTGARASGEREAIWLTRRLLERLIPVLVDWIEQEGSDLPRPRATTPQPDSLSGSKPRPAKRTASASASQLSTRPTNQAALQPSLPRPEPLHEFAQQMARSQLEQLEPVRAQQGDRSWLAHAVDIKRNRRQIILQLRGGHDEAAALSFAARPLRQWLNILFEVYVRAGWPLEIWPSWMHEANTQNTTASVIRH